MIGDAVSAVHRPIAIVSLYEQLEKHLMPLKRQKPISLWSVDNILAGADRDVEIQRKLNAAQIILLLLSADFLEPERCYDSMTRVLQLRREKNVQVVPIILRSCAWEASPVSTLQVLPTNGKSVTAWRDRDDAFVHVTREISKVVETLLNPAGDDEGVTETHQDYLHWLIKRTVSLDTRGISSAQRLPQIKLEDVYISLSGSYEDISLEADSTLYQEEPAGQAARQAPQLLSHIVARHSHLMILGEPGSGKTTFLRYLALQHALALRDQSEESDAGEVRFPILLRIADYVEHGMRQGKNLSEFLVEDCSRHECPCPQSAYSTCHYGQVCFRPTCGMRVLLQVLIVSDCTPDMDGKIIAC